MYSETIETLVEFFLNGEPIAYFLSGYYDNKQFEIELNETADDLFYKYINSNSRLSEIERAKIIVSLTYISQKEYVDGTILPVFRQKYKRSSSSCSDVTFDKYIRSLLEDYRDKIKYFDRTQYVAVPLVACVLPHSYANKLMSISYDIYKKSLLLDSDLTDIQIKLRIQDIFKRMKEKKLLGDNDSIKSTNYLMSRYTQSCISSGVYLDDLIDFISESISLIKDFVWEKYSKQPSPFFADSFSSWKKEYEDSHERQKDDGFLATRACFKLENHQIIFVTKRLLVSKDCADEDLFIKIRDKKIAVKDVFDYQLDEVNTGKIVESMEINLVKEGINPLDKFSYSIVHKDDELYSSNEMFYRNAIFFDSQTGREVKPFRDYVGNVFCVSKHLPNFKDCVLISNREDFVLSYFYIDDKQSYIVDEKIYYFNSQKSERVIGEKINDAFFLDVEGTKRIDLYKTFNSIIFETRDELDNAGVYDCGSLIANALIIQNKEGWTTKCFVNTDDLKNGYHKIEILDKKTKKQIKNTNIFEFILDNQFEKSIVDSGENYSDLTISSSLFSKQSKRFNYNDVEIIIPGGPDNYLHGHIHINPGIKLMSLDQGETWIPFLLNLYIKKLANSFDILMLKGFSDLAASFRVNAQDRTLELEKVGDFEWIYKCKLTSLRTFKSTNKYIRIQLKEPNCITSFVLDFYPTIHCIKQEVETENGIQTHKLIYKVNFDETIKYTVFVDDINNPINSGFLDAQQKEIVLNKPKPFLRYSIHFFAKSGGFGFDNKAFYFHDYMFFSSDCLAKRKFLISSLELSKNRIISSKQIKKLNFYITFVSRDKNFKNSKYYFGKIASERTYSKENMGGKPIFDLLLMVKQDEFGKEYVEALAYKQNVLRTKILNSKKQSTKLKLNINDPNIFGPLFFSDYNSFAKNIPENKYLSRVLKIYPNW